MQSYGRASHDEQSNTKTGSHNTARAVFVADAKRASRTHKSDANTHTVCGSGATKFFKGDQKNPGEDRRCLVECIHYWSTAVRPVMVAIRRSDRDGGGP